MAMRTAILILIMTLVAPTAHGQLPSSAAESHIAEIIRELPSDSELRRDLLRGARGSGVHYQWMDAMQQQKIRRVIIWVDILFDKKGRARKITLNKTQYFESYEGGEPISDTKRQEAIRASGLQAELSALALRQAQHGSWLDVPHPVPQPFVGGTKIEFLDDEWLPVPPFPMYYAGGIR
jgi:hypothetical protein